MFKPPAPPRGLRMPPFGAYLVVVACWFFGFGVQTTVFPSVVTYTLEAGSIRLSIAQAALTAPMMLLLPFTGVLAERVDRRGVMFVFYVFAGISALLLGGVLLSGRLTYWVMVAFALLIGVAGGFVMPARDSAINDVARISRFTRHGGIALQRAVIMASAIQFGAQILGMASGHLGEYFNPGYLFLGQGAILISGGIAALFLPKLNSERNRSTAHPMADLANGVRAVLHSPVLAPMTGVMIAIGVFIVGGALFILIPILVGDVYGGGYAELSQLSVTFWMGALVANVALALFGHVDRAGRALLLAQGVTVLAVGAFALPLPFWGLYVLVFAWGLGAGVAISLSRAVVQENAPPDKLARVMSVYQMGLFGGMPAGALLMGPIVAAIGPRLAALIPMIGLGLVLVWVAAATPILAVRRREPPRRLDSPAPERRD